MVDWKDPPKLFIPGPVKVLPEVLEQLARPTLGHRGKEYSQLHGETVGMLKKMLSTEQSVFLSTSSASGVWEGCIRNGVKLDEKILCTMCGAFSDKFAMVSRACGRVDARYGLAGCGLRRICRRLSGQIGRSGRGRDAGLRAAI